MIDERNATWKLLLPHHPDAKILALGLKNSQLVSLARTWARIDYDTVIDKIPGNHFPEKLARRLTKLSNNQLPRNTFYDIIVLGSASTKDNSQLATIHSSLLKTDGVMISIDGLNSRVIRSHFAGQGAIEVYGVLPPGNARVIFPLTDRRIRDKGLHFHSPSSRNAQIGIWIAAVLNSIGISCHLKRNHITLLKNDEISKTHYLKDWLSKRLNLTVEDIILYCGSDTVKRKITGLIFLRDHPDLVLKVADTAEGKDAITCESAALNALSTSSLRNVQLPQLLFEDEWGGYLIQVQSCLTGQSKKQTSTLETQHFTVLSALSHLDRRLLVFSETTYFLEIQQLAEQQEKELPRQIKELIEKISDENFKQDKILCHRVHGDFTPWNMSTVPDELLLWDWEDSISDGIVFTDIFHFIIRKAILVGPWPGAGLIIREIKKACSTVQNIAALPMHVDFAISLQIWIALEYLRNPHPELIEIANSLEGTHG